MEWQLRNWNYFTWLSGDHIVEQHVHNLDVMNWVLGAHPVRAVSGLGGRQVRTGDRHGHIFDHFAVEFEYPNGVTVFSQCRQINGCQNIVVRARRRQPGHEQLREPHRPDTAARSGGSAGRRPAPYRLTHEDLIASILAGTPINEAQAMAESTMTGILGREAVYSGQAVTWEKAMQVADAARPGGVRDGELSDSAGCHAGPVPLRVAGAVARRSSRRSVERRGRRGDLARRRAWRTQ